MYETESDKFSFYTLLYLPLPDCSFYFVPLRLTNFYFNLIQFRMKQKIYEYHFEVGERGSLIDLNLDAIISEVERDGYTVKQISTCYSDKHYPSKKEYFSCVHVFLLAEKP